MRLAEFDYTIEYKKGKKNQIADALSRLPTTGETHVPPDLEIPVLNIEHSFEFDEELIEKHILEDLHDDEDLLDIYTVYSDKYNIHVGKYLNNNPPRGEHNNCCATINVSEQNGEGYNHVCPLQPTPLPALTDEDIIFAQNEDEYCKNILKLIQENNTSEFLLNNRGMICRKSPVDFSIQIVLPEKLREQVLYISHYSKSAGHPGGARLYSTLRKTFYWPRMVFDAYNTVRNCVECAKRRIKLKRHRSFLKLFPAKCPGEHVAIDILEPCLLYTSDAADD